MRGQSIVAHGRSSLAGPIPKLEERFVWTCYGVCDLCDEEDSSTGACSHVSTIRGNPGVAGDEEPEYVCGNSEDEAAEAPGSVFRQ